MAKSDLERIEQALNVLNGIASSTSFSFAEKVNALLAMGCDQFNLPIGILSHIVDDRYEVVAAISPDGALKAGQTFPLGETFCRDTVTDNTLLAYENIGQSDWKSHPAYDSFKLESYIGVPVLVGDIAYGTLNFSSPEPRVMRFSSADREILMLMALWIGGALQAQEEARLLQSRVRQLEQTRNALREERDFIFTVLNTVDDLVLVQDRQGRIVRFNRKCSKVTGYTYDEVRGRLFWDILLPPEDRSAMREKFLNPSGDQFPSRHESGLLTKDGGTRLIAWSNAAVLDEKGDVEFVISTGSDITEMKSWQQALKESEEKYRLLFENATDAIYLIDPVSSLILDSNKKAGLMAGFSSGELKEMTILDLHPAEERATLAAQLSDLGDTAGKPIFNGFHHRRKDGTLLPIVINATRIVLGDRDVVLLMVRDMTEQVLLEKEREDIQGQLLQSQKMESIGRLAGGVAHDFNNLLTSILGYAELALMDLPLDNPVREHVEVVRSAGEKAAALTRQLLAFSRKQLLETRAVSLNSVVAHMSKMLERVIGEDVLLELKVDPSVRNIMADPGQVEQILMNLVVNSRDAMPTGGRLVIETRNVIFDEGLTLRQRGLQPGRYVMLAVTDTGQGISKDAQEHIFEPFFTTKELGKGTGLGLATVYGIVKQHGGHIYIYSEPGHGTTFKVYFPAAAEAEKDVFPYESEKVVGGHETVLVVDDEPSIRRLVADTLLPLGYNVLGAASAQEALQLGSASHDRIDLLLTDVIMPMMNGPEMAELFREEHPEAKVIFMSGYLDTRIARMGRQSLEKTFLQKPLTPKKLARKLRAVLDERDD